MLHMTYKYDSQRNELNFMPFQWAFYALESSEMNSQDEFFIRNSGAQQTQNGHLSIRRKI